MNSAYWLKPDGIKIAIEILTLVLAVIGFIHGQKVYREQKTFAERMSSPAAIMKLSVKIDLGDLKSISRCKVATGRFLDPGSFPVSLSGFLRRVRTRTEGDDE